MRRQTLQFVLFALFGLILFLSVSQSASATPFTIPNRQPWAHVAGPCSGLDGAVFGLVGTSCGGTGTTFDTAEIFSPVVIKDVASAAAPCPGITNGNTCYRLWYVGTEATWSTPRIGYAVSPDGLNWTRVVGAETGGSVFAEGLSTDFDNAGVSYMSVMKDGVTFKMWYTGIYDDPVTMTLDPIIAGIGYATSSDGQTWTRQPGSLPGIPSGRVFAESGVVGTFDVNEAYVPNVIKDVATVDAPCAGVITGNVCYRMWYEGVTFVGGYLFRIGYATSPDGVNWTRVPGSGGDNSNLGRGSGFDANAVGISIVLKDGDLFRMWYEAKSFSDIYTVGHVVSTEGENWVRPVPNDPIFEGADDPATHAADNVWSHWVIKDGARYKMWYTTTTRNDPAADRFAYASMVPGTPLTVSRSVAGSTYTIDFTTTEIIPAEGYVLLTLPPEVTFGTITLGSLTGFEPGATLVADANGVTDAAAANATRGALLIRLAADEPVGAKSVSFTLPAPLSNPTELLLQTFDSREVLEYGLLELVSGTTAIQLSQLDILTKRWTFPVLSLIGLGLLTLAFLRRP
ncbi:MAG: hypothetical protein KA314_07770 [Chloroflexi bacterium]|nr:hypothetical protein [Chloroflexota bacterium]MBP8055726.1 hypothetical protein [Chloroflexota bacterium]